MPRHSRALIKEAQRLRSLGKTYGEINTSLNLRLAKSTLSHWCRNVTLPSDYAIRIANLDLTNLSKGRAIAHEINKIKREEYLKSLDILNSPISEGINSAVAAKIALAMLCLGEASKYASSSSFSLGSSDSRIITIFLELLKKCFDFKLEKVRCTVQCRADQDIQSLETYWRKVTKIPKRLFYKAQIDPRTKGKPTKKLDYKGVLRVDYFDTRVQLELESLAQLVYNRLVNGPVVYR